MADDTSVTVTLGNHKYTFPSQEEANAAAKQYNAIPQQVRNLADGLVDYKTPMPTGSAIGRPGAVWNSAAQLAMRLDPSWNAMEYPVRFNTLKSFRDGKDAAALSSFNMTMGHAGKLYDTIGKLNNSSWGPIANAPINLVAEKASGLMPERAVAEARYNQDLNALTSELTRAFRMSEGSEKDVQNWRNGMNMNASPDVQKAAINEAVVNLLGSRIKAQREKFKRGMGNASIKLNFFDPETVSTLKKVGASDDDIRELVGEDAATSPAAPTGPPQKQVGPSLPPGNGSAIDQDNAQIYYSAAGGDPALARQLAAKNGWKVQ